MRFEEGNQVVEFIEMLKKDFKKKREKRKRI